MKKKRYSLIPASYLVLIKNNKVLLQRRYNTGYQDGLYGFCAGHVEEKETFVETIIREAKEEIGIDLKADDLGVVHFMQKYVVPNPRELRGRVDVFIKAKKWKGEPKNMEPHKCDDVRWFPLNSLPKNTIPFMKEALKNIKNNKIYSEIGF
ncbi:MAG TPA: NUDIX domain-containing protein [Candidatus Moranbacteria bacterium]|nr:NUDIX domain-containing protein [Candidatus Moranbacteria bacterium]